MLLLVMLGPGFDVCCLTGGQPTELRSNNHKHYMRTHGSPCWAAIFRQSIADISDIFTIQNVVMQLEVLRVAYLETFGPEITFILLGRARTNSGDRRRQNISSFIQCFFYV